MRRIAWPLAPGTLLVPAGLVAAVAFGLSLTNFGWRPEWPATSALVHEHLSITGPVAAAAAFHRWAALTRTGGLLAAARVGGDRPEHLLDFGRSWLVLAVAYTAGLLPVFVRTAASATHGGPDLGPILLGYLGLGFAVALGRFLAAVAPVPVLAVFVAVLVFLLLQLPQVVNDDLAAALPVQWSTPAANERETGLLFRGLALVAAGAAMVAATRPRRNLDQPIRAAAPVVGAVVVFAAFLAAAVVSPPERVAAAADPPRECRTTSGIEVCVHAAHAADLPELVDTVALLVQAYGTAPAAVAGVYDAAAVPAGGVPEDYVVLGLILDQTTRDTAAEEVAAAMAGRLGCRRLQQTGDHAGYAAGMGRVSELARWLRGQAGIALPGEGSSPSEGFFAQPPDRVRAWLAANDDRVAGCALGAAAP
ncbi:hypothetical protein [Actinokineospora sp. NPDC004072]